MFTIALWVAGICLAIIILGKIPGISNIITPLFQTIFLFVLFVTKNAFEWVVHLTKTLIGAHKTFLEHLVMPREKYDPSIAIRRKQRGEE